MLGPGSIVAASRAGVEGGYRLIWLLMVAAVLMAVYTSMGARLGCALDVTPLAYVAKRAGRWLAALAGVSAFLLASGFQFGNNMGVAFAAGGLIGAPPWVWPIFFTNLFWTGISLRGLVGGFVPRLEKGDGVIARAMFPTTFSAVAAF